MKYAIGVDIGGTKIAMVIGSEDGKTLLRRKIRTQTGTETKACIKKLKSELVDMVKKSGLRKGKISGVGVCIPGAVNTKLGTVPRSPHLSGWEHMNLARILKNTLKLPVYMANDANAAAVAERIFGSARKVDDFIYMTVSTGVGGGIFVNGRLLEGTSFVAGEIGHMTIEPKGEKWKMGEVGCLEAYASGTAIARYVEHQLAQGKGSKALKKLRKKQKLTTKEIGQAALDGDKFSKDAFTRAGEYLGIGIGNLLNILNPEMIILGGGVWKSAPKEFWKSMMESTKRRSWPEAFEAVKIQKTKLGDRVGNLGALALVFQAHKRKNKK